MRILVTNDDGIYSPGLRALAEMAASFGEIRIVAPDVEQSSMGHAITAGRPLSYRKTPLKDFEAYRVNGTPADCVALGAYNWEKVDVVLSGINLGVNLGNSIWHSGTVAAAKQAALLGLQGIAFSTVVDDDTDFAPLGSYIKEILGMLLADPALKLVNVNLPENPKGIRWTRQSCRQYDGSVVPIRDPQGRQLYWFTVTPIEEIEEGTDRWAIRNGWASLTPLRLDLTNEAQLAEAQSADSR